MDGKSNRDVSGIVGEERLLSIEKEKMEKIVGRTLRHTGQLHNILKGVIEGKRPHL